MWHHEILIHTMKTFNKKMIKSTAVKWRVSLTFSYFIFCKLFWYAEKPLYQYFKKRLCFNGWHWLNNVMNSYRTPTTDLTHFKPIFHFYTLYTPCKNQKTFEFLMLFWGSGWEVGKWNIGLKWVNYIMFQRSFVWISNANQWLY